METKILNKKVGCALIAACLLAASSVRGSSVQNIGSVLLGKVELFSGEKITFYFSGGYRLKAGQDLLRSGRVIISLIEEGSNIDFEGLVTGNASGFLTYTCEIGDVKVDIFLPDGLVPAVLPNGKVTLFPWTETPPYLNPDKSVTIHLPNGSSMTIAGN